MKLTRVAAFVAAPVAVGALLFAPSAFAQTPTVPGPQTAACLTAQGVVTVKAQAAVKAALALGDATTGITPAQQVVIDKQVAVVAGLRVKLDAALALLDSSPSVANATAAQKVGADLTAAYTVLVGLPGVANLGAATDAAAAAQAALTAALVAQVKACEQDGPPRPTVTPTATPTATPTVNPTPTVAPTVSPVTEAPVATDIPVGAVDTGWK